MSAPVDVLAVIDARIAAQERKVSAERRSADEQRFPGMKARAIASAERMELALSELRQARAAVAELVEAAKRVESDNHGHGFTTPETLDALSAALAKFGGAA